MATETLRAATTDKASRGHPRRWWVLGVMSLSILMVFLDNTVVNTALPAISRDLSASTATLQWVVDGYTLLLAGLLLLGGTIGDRFGRRRWMFVGMAVFGLAAVGAALATSAAMLIAFRALQGAGAALVMPATLSILTDVFPRSERAKAIGIWTGVGGLGIGLGPAVGGFLVDELGWAAVFWLHIPVVVLALIGLAVIVPESRDSRVRRLDLEGGLLATFGLVALVYAIIQGNEAGWASAEILGSFALAAIFLVGFGVVETRSEHPMLPMRFFRARDFTGAVVTIGLVFFAMFVTFFFLTQFFQIVQGRSALEAGLLILPVSAAMMVGAPISGLLVKRIGPRYLLALAMIAMTFGTFLFTQVEIDTSTSYIVGALLAFGFAGGLGMAPLTDTVMAAVPVDDAGIGSAVNDVTRELGGALGIAAIGSFVNASYREAVGEALSGSAPPEVVEAARESVGVASVIAAELPDGLAQSVLQASNTAFVDAVTDGFMLSTVILAATAVFAFVTLPRHMRQQQAQDEPGPAVIVVGGEPELVPVPVRVSDN